MEEKSLNIREIQQSLNKIKIGDSNGELLNETDVLDEKTVQAITKFQYIVKKEPTGEVNEETLNVIKNILNKPILKIGVDECAETRYLQWRLSIYMDGIFGNETRTAVMKLQELNNIPIDGVVANKTWAILI